MQINEISAFLAQHLPFSLLDEPSLTQVSRQVEVFYLSEHSLNDLFNAHTPGLLLVRSGTFRLDTSTPPIGEGDIIYPFNDDIDINIVSPGLVYVFSPQQIAHLCESFKSVEVFLQNRQDTTLLKHENDDGDTPNQPISHFYHAPPIMLPANTRIHTVAETMHRYNVSSMLLTEADQLVGIVTDRDLRNRVLAADLSADKPVHEIMSRHPHTLSEDASFFDALSMMTQLNIHHLPVVNNAHQAVGMVTSSDLLRQQRNDVLHLIRELHKAKDLPALQQISEHLADAIKRHFSHNKAPSVVGKLISSFYDVVTQRLLTLYVASQDKALPPFCWLVFGSQARRDMVLSSDQDNALLIDNRCTEAERQQLLNMAEFVCSGLAACGLVKCEGQMMANNPALCLRLDDWKGKYNAWLRSPSPQAILDSQIFFDFRLVEGSDTLFTSFQQHCQQGMRNSIFLAALARDVRDKNVPLGIFNRLVYDNDDKQAKTINLKTRGLAIVNSIVRLYAVAQGINEVDTLSRLRALKAHAVLAGVDADNLRDIWIFLSRLRLNQQLLHSQTNLVKISTLSSLHRYQLKEAFQLLRESQQAVSLHYARGM